MAGGGGPRSDEPGGMHTLEVASSSLVRPLLTPRFPTGLRLSQKCGLAFPLLCSSVIRCRVRDTAVLCKCEQKGPGADGLQNQVDLVEARERRGSKWNPRCRGASSETPFLFNKRVTAYSRPSAQTPSEVESLLPDGPPEGTKCGEGHC